MAANSRYGITLKQLRELMEHRGREGVEKVRAEIDAKIVLNNCGIFLVQFKKKTLNSYRYRLQFGCKRTRNLILQQMSLFQRANSFISQKLPVRYVVIIGGKSCCDGLRMLVRLSLTIFTWSRIGF